MSKISRDNKKAGKKTTEQKTEARAKNEAVKTSVINEGKCCTCKFYGKPCTKKGVYVARKHEGCEVYKLGR